MYLIINIYGFLFKLNYENMTLIYKNFPRVFRCVQFKFVKEIMCILRIFILQIYYSQSNNACVLV